MIRFETSISNPFVKTGLYKMIKETRKSLFNRFDMVFQCYKYSYILAALEFRVSRISGNAHISLLGYSLFVSISDRNV
jgi:hypothetical protein